MLHLIKTCVWLILACALWTQAAAANRSALIIGNDKYRSVPPLRNAVFDAKTMAEAFTRAGYKATIVTDRDLKTLKDDIRRFRMGLDTNSEVVLYYAGHGVQLGGENFLLPIDVRAESSDQVRDDALSLSQILGDLRTAKPSFTLAIVDACRDNPFVGKGRAIGGRGLAGVAGATGQMVIYSAGEGQQALDRLGDMDSTPNGLFTRVFVKEMTKPGVPIDQVLRNVRVEVNRLATSVQHEQVPALYDQVLGNFYFYPARPDSASGGGTVQDGGAVVASFHPPAGALAPSKYPPAPKGFKDCDVCPEMLWLPPGRFSMGASDADKDREKDEGPRHPISIDYKLAVGKYAVTVEEFSRFVQDTGYQTDSEKDKGCFGFLNGAWVVDRRLNWRTPGRAPLATEPVSCVSWNDAEAYVSWLKRKSGKNAFRLLTEAEWEYATRAGASTRYAWGDEASAEQCEHANGADEIVREQVPGAAGWTVAQCNDGFAYAAPVGRFRPNRFGLYDMQGNVWQWTEDVWHESYEGAPADGSAWKTGGDAARRVLRGGSWFDNPRVLRASVRNRYNAARAVSTYGFRVARTE